MKKVLLFLTVLFLYFNVFAGDGDYAVSKIAPALLKNADAVVRLEDISFEIKSTHETYERTHLVITILNENGDKWADFVEGYDKLQEFITADGALYDATGKLLKRMKNKDLQDVSGVSEISLIDDNRLKVHNFYYKVYPYTIEYEWVTKYKYTLFFPVWMPQGSEKLSVELSRITIVSSPDYKFRYKVFNYNGEPVIATENNRTYSTWTAKDLPAIKKEIYSPDWYEQVTCVYFGPTDFEVNNYKGNMATWQDFGKFIYTLKQGRDVLPPLVKQTVHQLADGITDVRKKIQVLYEYMQKNTRYISIQLGIGGWQPFDATYVATKGYGDCKALTNYMYSILKEAGIPSNYSVIMAGRGTGGIIADLPSSQFNHVILSVPLEKDTMWLECTSQTLAAGYLSDFTCDRYALMVNEEGGKLVTTPKYRLNDNVEVRKITATLDEEATLKIHSESKYGSMQQDYLQQIINGLSKDKVKEFLHDELDFATYDLNSFEYKEEKSSLPVITETLDITVSNYATITGKRLFIMPNVMTRFDRRLSTGEERKNDVVLRMEFRDIDSVEIAIPAGFETESLPQPVIIESKFGKYTNSVKLNGNKVVYYRNMEHYSGRYPAKDYTALAAFYEAIYKADRNKIVFVKKETSSPKPF